MIRTTQKGRCDPSRGGRDRDGRIALLPVLFAGLVVSLALLFLFVRGRDETRHADPRDLEQGTQEDAGWSPGDAAADRDRGRALVDPHAGPPRPCTVRVLVHEMEGEAVSAAEVTLVYAGVHGDELLGRARTDEAGCTTFDATVLGERIRAVEEMSLDDVVRAVSEDRQVLMLVPGRKRPSFSSYLFEFGDDPAAQRRKRNALFIPQLMVRVEAEQHLDRDKVVKLPDRYLLLREEYEIDLDLVAGGEWRGRVIRGAGAPCPKLDLEFSCADEDPDPVRSRPRVLRTKSDGSFKIVGEAWSSVRIRAEVPGIGYVDSTAADLARGRDHDFGDLLLRPPLEISGCVTALDGTPLPGVAVLTERSALLGGKPWAAMGASKEYSTLLALSLAAFDDAPASRIGWEVDEEGRALRDTERIVRRIGSGSRESWAGVLTGPEGRFRLGNLHPGRCRVATAVRDLSSEDGYVRDTYQRGDLVRANPTWTPSLAAPRELFAGASDVAIECPGFWLVLSATSDTGHLSDTPHVDMVTDHDAPADLPSGAFTFRDRRTFELRSSLRPRSYCLPLDPPRAVLLQGSCGNLPVAEARFELTPGRHAVEHVFRFSEDPLPGRLQVIVTDESGNRYANARVTLIAEESDLVDPRFDEARVRPEGLVAGVTPGTYRIEVHPGRERDPTNFALPFVLEDAVEVRAGRTTRVEARAIGTGGRIRLCVGAAPSAGDSEDLTPASEWPEARCTWRRLGDGGSVEARRGVLFLREDFYPHKPVGENYWGPLMKEVPFDASRTSATLLPEGEYELEITAYGHSSRRLTVRIVPGTVTSVEATLKPWMRYR